MCDYLPSQKGYIFLPNAYQEALLLNVQFIPFCPPLGSYGEQLTAALFIIISCIFEDYSQDPNPLF